MLFPIIAFAVFGAAFSAPSDDINVKIAGGSNADIANYPYALQLEYMDELVCGAILVSSTYALTAAHCCDSRDVDYFVVRAGSSTLYEGGQALTIKQITYHPQYVSATNYYGVALLQLSDSVTGASPIQLATNDDALVEGASVTVMGWGWTEFTYEAEFATTLQVVDLLVVNEDVCTAAHDIVAIDCMFCAAYLVSSGKGQCFGDQGGPVVVNGVLVGIMSFGQGCGDGTHPGVYIRASKVKDWVQGIVG